MVRRERGAGGVFLFIVIMLAMLVVVAMFTFSRMSSAVDAQAQTKASLAAAAAALDQYAGSTGNLPCPANPAVDDGLAVANGVSNCQYPQGVLPWATIGMRRDDAYDAWGWKISYRVYSGAGGMTQPNGASMVNCDTVQALTQRATVDANKLCPVAHNTVDSDFISGKGLTVVDFGTTYDGTKASGGAAYVLISHGPSGFGAYTGSGSQNTNTPKSTDEKNNLKDTGPFTLEAASDPTVPPDDNSHYDDVLFYRTVADLAKKANLAARDWPDTILAGVTFDSTTVGNALGHSPGSGDLGVTSLSFPYSTVSGYTSGGAQDLAFVTGSTTGIGGAGGSGNNLNSSAGEGIRIDLKQKAQRLAITLGNFGTGFWFFFFPYAEQAQFDFYSGGSPTPVYSTTVAGCKSDGGLASFTIDAGTGVQFDTVKVTSVASTISFQASSFNIAEFDTCGASGTCTTTLDTGAAPTGNHCTP